MIEKIRKEIELIYNQVAKLPNRIFSICPSCNKRLLEKIIEELYCSKNSDCRVCQSTSVRIKNEVSRLLYSLQRGGDLSLRQYLQNRSNRKTMIAVLYGIYTHGPHVPCVFPLTCSIELTHRCNLRCNHCYMGEIQSSAEMDNETLRDLIKDVADAGFVAVCLSGGEPLLRDDLQRIMCEIKKYDMDVILSTNGLLLSEECVQELKSLVDLVCISLDSHEEEIHDSFRGLNGSQKMTLQGINNCISQDVQVRIFTTLTKFNHKKLPELIRFVERMGINEIAFFDLNPVGKGKKGGRKDQLTVEELKEAVTLLNKKKESSRLKIDVLAPLNFYEKSSYINQMTLLSGGFCNAGISTVNISPDGIVQPCSRLRINLGNIKESKLQSIWKNSTVLKEIRDRSRLKGVCGECEHKYFCGGCRANAYSRYGDFLMEDMRCS